MIDLNDLNEYGVPLHACNGYRFDEHYWSWLKYIRLHHYRDMAEKLAGPAWSGMSSRRKFAALEGCKKAVANLSAQIDRDMFALAAAGKR